MKISRHPSFNPNALGPNCTSVTAELESVRVALLRQRQSGEVADTPSGLGGREGGREEGERVPGLSIRETMHIEKFVFYR
jgi:hypothetical protein